MDTQIAVLVGFVVSLGLQLVKKVWPGFNATEALTKQVTVCAVAGVSVLSLAGWRLDKETLAQAAWAAVAALGTHKGLLAVPAVPATKGGK